MIKDEIVPTLVGLYESQRQAIADYIDSQPPHKQLSRAVIIREAIDAWLRAKQVEVKDVLL